MKYTDYVTILDYSSTTMIEVALTDDMAKKYLDNIPALLRKIELNEDECSWIISDHPIARERILSYKDDNNQEEFEYIGV